MQRECAPFLVVALMLFMSLATTIEHSSEADEDASVLEVQRTAESSHNPEVEQFGVGFDETVIVSTLLSRPRDLEFHPNPSRSEELWVMNRADESATIVQDAGKSNQNVLNRKDAYADHFMSGVSAFAFGQWNAEFDNIFSTAQESRNGGNDFMGPALWPSSLSHFAMEHQSDSSLGSHLDMLHESPNGMGIAWDSGNAFWYFDGYYGELVYYDFVDDHDTGQEYHADGIVRRYTEITLTRQSDVPGHMIVDQTTGILYIADTGTGRVLWVNTDDTTTQSQNIYNSNTRMETLAEYSAITGMESGVLASGLSNPSGITISGDTLFVSQNGNGRISAYDLATDGKSGTHLETVDTSASSIMGLEIGPDDKLWYVDYNNNKVIRLDPAPDSDSDGVHDTVDNCPNTSNPTQTDYDSDGMGDACDEDDDEDGVLDDAPDDCPFSSDLNWDEIGGTDYDEDGCEDLVEDLDDDNDGVTDLDDSCPRAGIGWPSGPTTDHDGDGCRDSDEDDDDDADFICDSGGPGRGCVRGMPGIDRCALGRIGFRSGPSTDVDQDGCEDAAEDDDDDDDGVLDDLDACKDVVGAATEGTQVGCPDYDGDGWADTEDDYPANGTQWKDADGDDFGDNPLGDVPDGCTSQLGNSTKDRFGCPDSDGDGWSDEDSGWTMLSGADAFASDPSQWADRDGDRYGDEEYGFQPDACPDETGTSTLDRFGCLDSDSDGWSDAADAFPYESTQWNDTDQDLFGDSSTGVNADDCPEVPGESTADRLGCPDRDMDTWSNDGDAYPDDVRFWSDSDGDGHPDQNGTNMSDDCPAEWGNSTVDRLGCLDTDGDGVSDEADFYPQDASLSVEAEASSTSTPLLILLAFMVFGILAGAAILLTARGRSGQSGPAQPLPGDFMPPQPGLGPTHDPYGAPLLDDQVAPVDPYAAPTAYGAAAATPVTSPAVVDQHTEYVGQLIAQGYDPEVARTHALQYQQHADSIQAAYAAPMAAPVQPAPAAAPDQMVPAAAPVEPSSRAKDYTELPPNGDYQTDADGSTIYIATDGGRWRMNPDQSFDSI